MKIGYFTPAFPYKNPLTGEMTKPYLGGGVENVTYNLAVQMAKKGHNVFVFTSSMESQDTIENYGKIKIYRYKSNFKIGQTPIPFGLIYKPLLSKIDLDIVHTHMGNLPAPLTAYLYAKKTSKNLIISYHGDGMGGFGGLLRRLGVFFNNYLCDFILSEAYSIITLSEYYAKQSKVLPKYNKKLIYIPNGVCLDNSNISYSKDECRKKLDLDLDKKIVLFVGSLVPMKAPDVLINAMKKVVEKVPNSYLIILGDGVCKQKLERLTQMLNLLNNTDFKGYISDEVLKSYYYKSADIFVLPSISESFGIVLLEASTFELPLIVSNLQSFKAIVVEGSNGLFSKKNDSEDLAKNIIYLLNNDQIREEMGRNAKNKVSKFSWQRIADETEKVYWGALKLLD